MTGYLLDTHVALWWLANAPLAPGAAEVIAGPDNLLFLSAASVWEVAIKRATGKLRMDDPAFEVFDESFEPLAIDARHARTVASLPALHRDPFDRMLIAQATSEGLTIITRDRAFEPYDVRLLAA